MNLDDEEFKITQKLQECRNFIVFLSRNFDEKVKKITKFRKNNGKNNEIHQNHKKITKFRKNNENN